jgi:hypothetical protein
MPTWGALPVPWAGGWIFPHRLLHPAYAALHGRRKKDKIVTLNFEEPRVAGKFPKGKRAQVGEAEAGQLPRLEPGGVVEVLLSVRAEGLEALVRLAGYEGADADDASQAPGIVLQVRTSALLVKAPALLGVIPLVRDLGGVDEQRPEVFGAPAADLDGFQAGRQQGGPGLLQRQGIVRHGGGPSRGKTHLRQAGR